MKSPMIPPGRLLKAARYAAMLSQAELAEAAGIEQSTLSRLESAGMKPVGGVTRNLAAVLDALKANGVEVTEDTIRLTKRRR